MLYLSRYCFNVPSFLERNTNRETGDDLTNPECKGESHQNHCGYLDVANDAEEIRKDEKDGDFGKEDARGPKVDSHYRGLDGVAKNTELSTRFLLNLRV